MIASDVDHFVQFRTYRRENKGLQAKNQETVSLLLSNFGNDVLACSEKFFEEEIEFKDLASLTREDLQLFGIKNYEKQTEILETFSQLSKQDYSLNEIKVSSEGQKYNSQILEKATSYLDTMKLSLTATNLKLKLNPSGDIVLDERDFASKFVLNALSELQNVTQDIEKELECLEKVCFKNVNKTEKTNKFFNSITLGTLTIFCISFAVFKLRF